MVEEEASVEVVFDGIVLSIPGVGEILVSLMSLGNPGVGEIPASLMSHPAALLGAMVPCSKSIVLLLSSSPRISPVLVVGVFLGSDFCL